MKGYRIFAVISLAIGLLLGSFTFCMAQAAPEVRPEILELDPAAGETARGLLDAVARGDLAQAGELLLGGPQLTAPERNDRDPAWLLWRYYYDNLTVGAEGEVYAAQGLRQDVVFTVPDLNRITERIGALAPEILTQFMESAEDVSQVYDETGGYRQELTEQVLLEAARRAMAEPVILKEQRLSLGLAYEDGRWYVRTDQALLNILAGALEKR